MRIALILCLAFLASACVKQQPPIVLGPGQKDALPAGETYLLLPVASPMGYFFEFCGRRGSEYEESGSERSFAVSWCTNYTASISFEDVQHKGGSSFVGKMESHPALTLGASETGIYSYRLFKFPAGRHFLARFMVLYGLNNSGAASIKRRTLAFDAKAGKINYVGHFQQVDVGIQRVAYSADAAERVLREIGGDEAAGRLAALPLMEMTVECDKSAYLLRLTGYGAVETCQYSDLRPVEEEKTVVYTAKDLP